MTAGGRLRDLADAGRVGARLEGAGHAPARAAELRCRLDACAAALRRAGARDDAPAHAFVVPGRVEVLGKHTDYAGGRSLLAAVERAVASVATPRADARVRVLDVARGEEAWVALDPELPPAAGWATYPATAARRLARNFPAARTGADVAFASDLPAAGGMSSSSALVVTAFCALAAVNRLEDDAAYRSAIRTPEELAAYLGTVENGEDFGALRGDRGVGTRGGSEDHVAMLCARPGHVVQYAFAPVRFERAVALPAGHGFVIGVSGRLAEKTGAARADYNRASELMRVAAELWRDGTGEPAPTLGAALDADPGAAARVRALLAASRDPRFPAAALVARVDQFVAESRELLPAAADALARGDLVEFGGLVDQSQGAAERLLTNQVPETILLARLAREGGAAAASAFGAGFGGSVWALVADAAADEFARRWRRDYLARFPHRAGEATFFRTPAAPPLTRVQ